MFIFYKGTIVCEFVNIKDPRLAFSNFPRAQSFIDDKQFTY